MTTFACKTRYNQFMNQRKYKICYCAPALYSAGGVERVVSFKASYFAEVYNYDVTIIVTEGKGRECFFPLSDKVKVVNLNLGFEELWKASFIKKVFLYLTKQFKYRRMLKSELMRIRPDFTISVLRREINFINDIKDGSKKIGELHTSRQNNRNFKDNEINFVKAIFAKYWNKSLIHHLRKLDKFVVLTNEDRDSWTELDNVISIPNPVSFKVEKTSDLTVKRVLSVGRYDYVKGFDRLLKAWAIVTKEKPDWTLAIYGDGDNSSYVKLRDELGIDASKCQLHGVTSNIQEEYRASSIYVLTSRFEGLSMAMLEAISCGLPLIAFACPCGPRDVVEDGVNGYLVENGNVEKLAERLIAVMQSPERLQQMGMAAQEKSKQYQIENLALKWKQLFENICSTS